VAHETFTSKLLRDGPAAALRGESETTGLGDELANEPGGLARALAGPPFGTTFTDERACSLAHLHETLRFEIAIGLNPP